MADQRILYTEKMVGANHPNLPDTLNRLSLIEHNTDGTHKFTTDTTQSSSTSTGAIVTAGGIGVAKNVNIGGDLSVTGHATLEGVTPTGATGTGKIVFDTLPTIASPTISGHATIEGVSVAGATGTGNIVFSTSPTLTTPSIGVATGTSFNSITGLSATTPSMDGSAAVGTATTTARADHVHPSDTAKADKSGNLSQFAATTSAQLAGVISDETGSGALVFANTPTLIAPVLGTPNSGTLTNCTGLPISTGVSGMGTNVGAFLGTPTSANLAAAITDETGTGALVFANSPNLVTPNIGVASGTSFNSITALSSTLPSMDSVAAIGTSTAVARADHTHPSDTSKAAAADLSSHVSNTSNPHSVTATQVGLGNVTNESKATMFTSPTFTGHATVEGVTATGATGTGKFVFDTSPTLVTPVLGVATGTSFNSITGLSSTTPAMDGSAAVGTGTTTARADHVHPTDTSRAATSGTLAQFAATTSAQLAGVISDETGSGSLVFATSPTLVTPALGTPASGDFSTGTFTWPTFNQNTSGTAAGLSATLATTSGGTGLTSFTSGGVVYASSTSALTTGSGLTFDGTNFATTGAITAGSGSTGGVIIKPYNSTSGSIWSAAVTPSSSNYSFNISSTSTEMGVTSGGILLFSVAGSEKMRLDSSGNLGIGTTSASQARIQVKTPSNGIAFWATNDATLNYSRLYFGFSDSGSYTSITADGRSNGYIAFTTNDTERMRLDSSGNLGIGVAPSAWNSNYKAIETSFGAFAGNASGVETSIYSNTYRASDGKWYYKKNGVAGSITINDGSAQNITFNTAANGSAGALVNGTGSLTNAMTLDSNGLIVNASMGTGTTPFAVGYTSGATFIPRLKLDDNGNLGIGVTPSYKLHILAPSGGTAWYATDNVNATMELKFASGSKCIFDGNGNSILFNSGATNLATLDSSGNLLVGCTSFPGAGTSTVGGSFNYNGALSVYRSASTPIFAGRTNDGEIMALYSGTTQRGQVSISGATTTYGSYSDYRLKENIADISGAIDKMMSLKPRKFNFKEFPENTVEGFIAHELQDIVPIAVTGYKDETKVEEYEVSPKVEATFDEEGNELTPAVEAVMGEREVPVYQGIDQSKIVPLLTAALQEAVAKIESLTERIAKLEAKGE